MAMLAEPRRKQKFSVDPRNLNWSNDDNRFGKKLMERMGWEKGKGLGANENGNPDHISIKLKEDKYGVGCSKDYADNWVAHQDDFNALLSTLNANSATDEPHKAPIKSLEEKSKSSKGRIHYKKFARGKDLTKANSEDLNSIFGRRLSKSAPSTPQCQSEESSDAEDSGEESKEHGIVTIKSTTSVQDYFKQKMAALKAKSQGVCLSTPTSKNPSDEETKETTNSDSEKCEEPVKKKKKKSKKSKDKREVEDELESPDTDVAVKSKSKKSKKTKKDAKDLSESKNKVEDKEMQSSADADDVKSKSKKSKRKKNEKDLSECENKVENTAVPSSDNQEVAHDTETSKTKKKRKRETKDEQGKSEIDNELRQKKKKRRKAKELVTEDAQNESGEPVSANDTNNTNEIDAEHLKDNEQPVIMENPKQVEDNDVPEPVMAKSTSKRKHTKRQQLSFHERQMKRAARYKACENFSKNPSNYFQGSNLGNIQGYGR